MVALRGWAVSYERGTPVFVAPGCAFQALNTHQFVPHEEQTHQCSEVMSPEAGPSRYAPHTGSCIRVRVADEDRAIIWNAGLTTPDWENTRPALVPAGSVRRVVAFKDFQDFHLKAKARIWS